MKPKISCASTAISSPTRDRAGAAAERATQLVDDELELERVAGRDEPAEAHALEACEHDELAGEVGVRSTPTQPACASASTISTPGMIGRPGKCPCRKSSSPRTRVAAVHTLAGHELGDLVDEQERGAVRDDRLDRLAAERGGGCAHRPIVSS